MAPRKKEERILLIYRKEICWGVSLSRAEKQIIEADVKRYKKGGKSNKQQKEAKRIDR